MSFLSTVHFIIYWQLCITVVTNPFIPALPLGYGFFLLLLTLLRWIIDKVKLLSIFSARMSSACPPFRLTSLCLCVCL